MVSSLLNYKEVMKYLLPTILIWIAMSFVVLDAERQGIVKVDYSQVEITFVPNKNNNAPFIGASYCKKLLPP